MPTSKRLNHPATLELKLRAVNELIEGTEKGNDAAYNKIYVAIAKDETSDPVALMVNFRDELGSLAEKGVSKSLITSLI